MKSKIVMCGVAILLSGCITTKQMQTVVDTSTPATKEEKRAIVDYVRNNFKDPYSIQDAEISYFGMNPDNRRVGCVALNAKNSFGAYTGRKDTAVVMANGSSVLRTLVDAPDCKRVRRHGIRWQRFTELEAL